MAQPITLEGQEQPTEEVIQPVVSKIDNYTEEDKAYILKMRDEAKNNRIKLKEFEDNKLLEDKNKLIEDGKLQELIDTQTTELDTLKGASEENDKNKEYFNKVLESELDGLGDVVKEMILSSNGLIVDKIERAKQIKSEQGLKSKSPGSESIGAGTSTVTDDAITQEYRALKTPKERANYINTLRVNNPQALEKLKKTIT